MIRYNQNPSALPYLSSSLFTTRSATQSEGASLKGKRTWGYWRRRGRKGTWCHMQRWYLTKVSLPNLLPSSVSFYWDCLGVGGATKIWYCEGKASNHERKVWIGEDWSLNNYLWGYLMLHGLFGFVFVIAKPKLPVFVNMVYGSPIKK